MLYILQGELLSELKSNLLAAKHFFPQTAVRKEDPVQTPHQPAFLCLHFDGRSAWRVSQKSYSCFCHVPHIKNTNTVPPSHHSIISARHRQPQSIAGPKRARTCEPAMQSALVQLKERKSKGNRDTFLKSCIWDFPLSGFSSVFLSALKTAEKALDGQGGSSGWACTEHCKNKRSNPRGGWG